MATLTLPMKDVYFDQIAAGVKPLEYRLVNEYWTKRIVGRDFDRLVLMRRYPKGGGVLGETRLEMPWRGYEVQKITHPLFGPDPVEVFAIDVSALPAPPTAAAVKD